MEELEFKIEDGGIWKALKILGFYHATLTFNTNISVHPLSRIPLF